jgi:hypothetical protein
MRASGPFRQALSAPGLLWAVGMSRRQNVYPADIALTFPVAKTGNRRKYHVPDQAPISAELMLAGKKWKKITWRQGTKGGLTCRFAACRVLAGCGVNNHRLISGASVHGRRRHCTASFEFFSAATWTRVIPANFWPCSPLPMRRCWEPAWPGAPKGFKVTIDFSQTGDHFQ